MKKTADGEMQTEEYVPDGPVVLPPTEQDQRRMVHKDGSAAKAAERPVLQKSNPPPPNGFMSGVIERLDNIEARFQASCDLTAKAIEECADGLEKQATQIASLQLAVAAIERRQSPLVQTSREDLNRRRKRRRNAT